MKNIKQSAIDLTDLAIGIVALGVVVTIGAVILTNVANTQITNAATYNVNNETITPSTTGTALSTGWGKSIATVINGSATTINSGNYTSSVNPDTGVLTIYNTTSTFPTQWNVTYSVYNKSDVRYDLANKSAIGIGEYGNWFKIIVIVGVAAVVLSLIFMAFGRNNSGGQSY